MQIVANMVYKINFKNSELLWDVLANEINELFNAKLFNSDVEKHIDLLLQLCGAALEYRDGKFLNSNQSFIQNFIALDLQKLSQPVILTYCKVIVLLLLSDNVKLSQENASSLTKKIIRLNNEEIFLYFVSNVYGYSGFEALILPNLLKLCVSNKLDDKFLMLLTKIILEKSPLCGNGISLDSWRKYSIDFGSTVLNYEMSKILDMKIAYSDISKLLLEPVPLICSLICLSHMTVAISNELKTKLKQLVIFLCECVNLEKIQGQQMQLLLFLLQISLETLIHIADDVDLVESFEPVIAAVLPLSVNVEYLISLKILDLILTALRNQENVIQSHTLLKLDKFLQDNFCSPYHEVSLFFLLRSVFLHF